MTVHLSLSVFVKRHQSIGVVGAGPHLLSVDSLPGVVYQLSNRQVVFDTLLSLTSTRKVRWIVSVGQSWLNHTELAAIVNGDKFHTERNGNHSRLMFTADAVLNGTQYQFGYERTDGKLVYLSEKMTLNIGGTVITKQISCKCK